MKRKIIVVGKLLKVTSRKLWALRRDNKKHFSGSLINGRSTNKLINE
jgi:hypothetical protein